MIDCGQKVDMGEKLGPDRMDELEGSRGPQMGEKKERWWWE